MTKPAKSSCVRNTNFLKSHTSNTYPILVRTQNLLFLKMIWLIIRQIVKQDGSFASYFFVYGAYIFSVNLWTRIPIKQKFIWSVSSARSALREMKKMWRQGDSLRMKLCLPPCAHTNVVTELWGIYSNVFCTHGVHCFSSSYQNLLRSENFALFRDFFSASEGFWANQKSKWDAAFCQNCMFSLLS